MALRSRELDRGRRTSSRGPRVSPRVRALPFYDPWRRYPSGQGSKRCRPRVHGGGRLSGHSIWGRRSVRPYAGAGLPGPGGPASETRPHNQRLLKEKASAVSKQRTRTRGFLFMSSTKDTFSETREEIVLTSLAITRASKE